MKARKMQEVEKAESGVPVITLSVKPYGFASSPFCRCATSSPGRGKSFLSGGAD